MSYEHEYCEYDEFGLLRIRCQCCGVDVVRRHYVEVKIKSDPPRKENVMTAVKLGNYRRKRLVLSDGSFINLYICADCYDREEFDDECDGDKCDKIIMQLKLSSMNEDRIRGRKDEEEVVANSKRWDSIKAHKSIRGDVSLAEAHRQAVEIVERKKEKSRVGS